MLGNSVSGFAIGLVVLDYTNSTFLYALFMVMYMVPKIIVPLFAGPYLDRFSRRKTIYNLDFLSAIIYLGVFFFIYKGYFHYGILLAVTILIGTIDSVYGVAYESFYPNLISEGNYSKAYSISSMIYPLASFMVPVASIVYNMMGTTAYLFLFNAVSFFIAACFEMMIKHDEEHLEKTIEIKENEKTNFQIYREDFKEGLKYIFLEKGLLVITIYFCIASMAGSASGTVLLPFFKNNEHLFANSILDVVTLYTIVTGMGVVGRLIGGVIHYKYKYPTEKKFLIALFVYGSINVLEAVQLYLPIPVMMVSFFIIGIMGVTSFNIRISSTQSYVPDEKRGRFNGIFQMICAAGTIVGQLLAGAMAEFMPERIVIVIFMIINMFAVVFVMRKGKEHVKKIYNRNV